MVCAYPHALVLEMGTSLGVSTAYLAKASGKGRVMALEGAPALAEAAQSLHQQFQIRNVQWQVGPFQTTLEPLLNSLETSIDFIYLDGHHQGEAVLAYTRQLLPYISDNGLLVVDDIRWSKDMYAAWQELQRSGAFDTCLDLGWAGVLFKGDQAPLEEAIIPWRWKPWQLGFLAT